MKRARRTTYCLLGAMALLVVSGFSAFVVSRERAFKAVEEAGGQILFDFHERDAHNSLMLPQYEGGRFVGQIRGDSWLKYVNVRALGEPKSIAITKPIESPSLFGTLSRFKELERLEIGEIGCSTRDLQLLRRCRNLRELCVSWEVKSNADLFLKDVAKLPTLQELNIHGMELTDAGVKELEGHPSLVVVLCSAMDLSPRGLESFSRIPKLKSIFLVDTPRITDDQIDRAIKANPQWVSVFIKGRIYSYGKLSQGRN